MPPCDSVLALSYNLETRRSALADAEPVASTLAFRDQARPKDRPPYAYRTRTRRRPLDAARSLRSPLEQAGQGARNIFAPPLTTRERCLDCLFAVAHQARASQSRAFGRRSGLVGRVAARLRKKKHCGRAEQNEAFPESGGNRGSGSMMRSGIVGGHAQACSQAKTRRGLLGETSRALRTEGAQVSSTDCSEFASWSASACTHTAPRPQQATCPVLPDLLPASSPRVFCVLCGLCVASRMAA